MLNRKFIFRRLIVLFHDVAMTALAWMGTYIAHQNIFPLSEVILKQAIILLPIVIFIQSSFFIIFGLYRGVWQFASLLDLTRILKSTLCGVMAITLYVYLTSIKNIPVSIPIMYAAFLILFLSFGRIFVRMRREYRPFVNTPTNIKRLLIVGAGESAEKLIREIVSDKRLPYQLVAIVDDDKAKINLDIHGVRIVGVTDQIPIFVDKYHIDKIFIGISKASSNDMDRILRACQAAKIPFRIIPSLSEQLQQNNLLSTLREVNLDDLLGRDVYDVDMQGFSHVVQHKKVLVTGGGGSIGSELCRQIASLKPSLLVIVDHSESNLYHIELSLKEEFPHIKTRVALIDVARSNELESVFSDCRPNIVFHAAAYKHVPMLEKQIHIAAQNNIIGTKSVVDLAVQFEAEVFVQVSTDKAVNPSNVMGLTKRAAEIYCQNIFPNKTKIITVRFGNVLGSVGSVVPLFKKQLERGGPLTVTHPEVTRYFMTIPEACRLILQAMVMGMGGEIFVLDMGSPVKIKSLAERMIFLAGKRLNEDVFITYTGLRPGEKLWEELFYHQEKSNQTKHQKIFLAETSETKNQDIDALFQMLLSALQKRDEHHILETLVKLVPTYLETKNHHAEAALTE